MTYTTRTHQYQRHCHYFCYCYHCSSYPVQVSKKRTQSTDHTWELILAELQDAVDCLGQQLAVAGSQRVGKMGQLGVAMVTEKDIHKIYMNILNSNQTEKDIFAAVNL